MESLGISEYSPHPLNDPPINGHVLVRPSPIPHANQIVRLVPHNGVSLGFVFLGFDYASPEVGDHRRISDAACFTGHPWEKSCGTCFSFHLSVL